MHLSLAGEPVTLRPDPALVWGDTAFVADVHLGKVDTFRAHGIGLPRGADADTLQRLSTLMADTGAGRLVVLGDLIHAAEGLTDAVLDAWDAWLRKHAALDVVLVRGNHDRRAPGFPGDRPMRVSDDALVEPPFVLQHRPDASDDGYVLAGHVHPAHVMRLGRRRERLPCFHATPDAMTLPAFGEFTGGATVTPGGADRVYVVAGDAVIAV